MALSFFERNWITNLQTRELEPQSRMLSISDLFICVSTSDPKRGSREEAVCATSTRPSEANVDSIERPSSYSSQPSQSSQPSPSPSRRPRVSSEVRCLRLRDLWLFCGSTGGGKGGQRIRTFTEVPPRWLSYFRRRGQRREREREEGDGGKHSGIRAPTSQKSEPGGSLQSARAAGTRAVAVALTACRPHPRKPRSPSALERERKGK
jgi:hypothetical protein